MTLAWNPSTSSGLAGYRVYSGVATQTYTNILSVGLVTNATMTGLVPGITYFFAVTAVDTTGLESAHSGEVSYTVPVTSTNTPPTISTIANQTITENTSTGPIPFTVQDQQTPASALTIAATSSGPTVVPIANIVLSGTGTNRTVLITPATNQIGTATITLTVSDGLLTASTSFLLLVASPSPVISLTAPANGAGFAAPANIAFSASVTANGHSINKVQFFNGTTLLAESTNTPYGWTWSNVAAGNYSLSAKAVYDGASVVSSSFANVIVTNPLPAIILSSPLQGSSYTAPASIGLAASVNPNGHSITAVEFYASTGLLAHVTAAPYNYTWTNVSAGNYSLTARALYDASGVVASPPTAISVLDFPPPWQTADIGNPGVAGSATFSNNVYSVQGAGNISGSADSFRFLYQGLSGDGEIRAQISSVQSAGTGGVLGVMIRESLTSGSRYALLGISPSGTFRWQRRTNTNGGSGLTKGGSGTLPNVWARLVRIGNTIYGYKSTDGVNWSLVNSGTINMATNIYVGLAVSSGSTSSLNTGVFNNLTVVP